MRYLAVLNMAVHDVDTLLSRRDFYRCVSTLFFQSGIVGHIARRAKLEGVVCPAFVKAAFESIYGLVLISGY